MNTIAYLIELRDPKTGNTDGYLENILTAGTFDVAMTKDPNKALRFTRRENAQAILDDAAFQHAMGAHNWAVEEHVWMDSPVSEDAR
jgi:hypothetical protein